MKPAARQPMRYSLVVRFGTMMIAWLSLLAWHQYAAALDCSAIAAYLAALTLLLVMSGSEYAYARRRAFLNEYLFPGSWLFHLLDGRLAILVRELLKSALLALVLLIGSLLLEPRQWSLLLADAVVLSLILPRFMAGFGDVVRDEYRYVLARRWAIWISSLLLWFESLLVMLFNPGTEYLGLRWQEVISYGTATPRLACPWLGETAHAVGLLDVLGIWAAQNASRQVQDPAQLVMIGLGWCVALGLAFAFAWAYSQVIVGTLTRPWASWRNMPRAPRAGD